jgi:hypothetical protein
VIREDCILFSGAAAGAEAAFGAAAERHGLDEVNFTFTGHNDARQRGLRVLTRAELKQGDVNLATIGRLMNRRYPETPLFRKVLQTIWHQVHHGEELFVVGRIQPDDTVVGGTGIAAEYAKLFMKPVHVFDQTRAAWFHWGGERWEPAPDPVITRERFTGTGTRFLEPSGQQAIADLFARSFRA